MPHPSSQSAHVSATTDAHTGFIYLRNALDLAASEACKSYERLITEGATPDTLRAVESETMVLVALNTLSLNIQRLHNSADHAALFTQTLRSPIEDHETHHITQLRQSAIAEAQDYIRRQRAKQPLLNRHGFLSSCTAALAVGASGFTGLTVDSAIRAVNNRQPDDIIKTLPLNAGLAACSGGATFQLVQGVLNHIHRHIPAPDLRLALSTERHGVAELLAPFVQQCANAHIQHTITR